MTLPVADPTLEKIRDILVETYHPETIWLFGSRAWGEPTKDSDYDIAVVVKESDEKNYRRIQRGGMALWGVKAPIDLLVYTREEFQEWIQYKSTLQYEILHEGLKVYEAA